MSSVLQNHHLSHARASIPSPPPTSSSLGYLPRLSLVDVSFTRTTRPGTRGAEGSPPISPSHPFATHDVSYARGPPQSTPELQLNADFLNSLSNPHAQMQPQHPSMNPVGLPFPDEEKQDFGTGRILTRSMRNQPQTQMDMHLDDNGLSLTAPQFSEHRSASSHGGSSAEDDDEHEPRRLRRSRRGNRSQRVGNGSGDLTMADSVVFYEDDEEDDDAAKKARGRKVPKHNEPGATQGASSSAQSPTSAAGTTTAGGKARRRYVCQFCDNAYTRSEHLKRHVRSIHTNKRPHQCAVCLKTFTRKDNMWQHAKIHGTEAVEALQRADGDKPLRFRNVTFPDQSQQPQPPPPAQ